MERDPRAYLWDVREAADTENLVIPAWIAGIQNTGM